MKTARKHSRRWMESRLRRLAYKLDAGVLDVHERNRCEDRELYLKRALYIGWHVNVPAFTRRQWATIHSITSLRMQGLIK